MLDTATRPAWATRSLFGDGGLRLASCVLLAMLSCCGDGRLPAGGATGTPETPAADTPEAPAADTPEAPAADAPEVEAVLSCTVYDSAHTGLPDDFVVAIAVADDSTVWAGTFEDGLARFDGETWTVFDTESSPLPANEIHAIATAENGEVWIGTESGLARLSGGEWTVYDHRSSGLGADFVWSVAVSPRSASRADDGTVWAGAMGPLGFEDPASGLYSFDGLGWRFHGGAGSPFPCPIVTAIAPDLAGGLWVGTDQCHWLGGLFHFDGETWIGYSTETSPLRYNTIDEISISSTGDAYVSTAAMYRLDGTFHGLLMRFDGHEWQDLNPSSTGALSNRVKATVVDRNDRLWVATSVELVDGVWYDYALSRYDHGDWEVMLPGLCGLPRSDVYDLAVDGRNRVWAATGYGVVRIDQGTEVGRTQTSPPRGSLVPPRP